MAFATSQTKQELLDGDRKQEGEGEGDNEGVGGESGEEEPYQPMKIMIVS